MSKKLVNSQLNNFMTYEMYKRQLLTLAENVFEFVNLPEFIDVSYLNKVLLRQGAIAFFKDEFISDSIIALPFRNTGKLDVYGRPLTIEVYSNNGYSRTLKQGEFVIMYDNNGRYPLYLDIIQYAERIALLVRTIDINISQQKTPRFWKTKQEYEKSIKDMLENIDGFSESIITYNNIDLDDTELVLSPAPFVSDKIDVLKNNIWNEFLRLVGIANMQYTKKERNIKDEISAMQGGTIASRYSRFEPRKRAIEEINQKFDLDLEVRYYDNLPTTIEDFEDSFNEENFEESEVE